MKQHIVLSVHAVNQGDKGISHLLSFPSVQEADHYLRHWLTNSCGLDCYCGEEERKRLCAEHGGELPELSFSCPEVKEAKDLEAYNGYHYFSMGGAITLFVMAIYDELSAKAFKKDMIREFELDKVWSEEADETIEMLDLLVTSFTEEVDVAPALAHLDAFLKNGGLGLF